MPLPSKTAAKSGGSLIRHTRLTPPVKDISRLQQCLTKEGNDRRLDI